MSYTAVSVFTAGIAIDLWGLFAASPGHPDHRTVWIGLLLMVVAAPTMIIGRVSARAEQTARDHETELAAAHYAGYQRCLEHIRLGLLDTPDPGHMDAARWHNVHLFPMPPTAKVPTQRQHPVRQTS